MEKCAQVASFQKCENHLVSSVKTFCFGHCPFPKPFYILHFFHLSDPVSVCPTLQSPRGPAASGGLLLKPDESDQDSVPGLLLQPPISCLHPDGPQVSPCTLNSTDTNTTLPVEKSYYGISSVRGENWNGQCRLGKKSVSSLLEERSVTKLMI